MNPDACRWNNPKWTYKGNSPFEISQLRNNNPCGGCVNKIKHKCSPLIDNTPMRQKKLRGGKIRRVDTKRHEVHVKGELLNAKRQLGLKVGVMTDRQGEPKLDELGNPIMGLVKVLYARQVDMPLKVSR